MRQAVALAAFLCVGVVGAQERSSLQTGLRFDSESSMQWREGVIYLVGRSHDALQTSATQIFNIWPGSVPGSFSISFDGGVGLLVGDRIVPVGHVFGEGVLLRSARVESVHGAIVSTERADTRFVEWRSINAYRELATVPGVVIDFDVDAQGRLLYLTDERRLFLLTDSDVTAEVTVPREFGGEPERVFLDGPNAGIVVFGAEQLARFTPADRQWTIRHFDTETQALVRHLVTRHMMVEDRFRE